MDSVQVFAPATVANVSCGFDLFGFAVDQPGDLVTASRSESPGVTLAGILGDQGRLPRDPAKNTASYGVQLFLRHHGIEQGVSLVLEKKMPFGSGLGSSAASAAAALVAVNALFDHPMTAMELLPFAVECERLACGFGHADNVAPALLGGFLLLKGIQPDRVISLPPPANLWCSLAYPHMEIRTEDARNVIPPNLPLGDAVKQTGNAVSLAVGLFREDPDLIRASLVDLIAEPYRAPFIPHYSLVRQCALDAGALGCGISGSGPTLFALCWGRDHAERAASAMSSAFEGKGLACTTFVSGVNSKGAVLL